MSGFMDKRKEFPVVCITAVDEDKRYIRIDQSECTKFIQRQFSVRVRANNPVHHYHDPGVFQSLAKSPERVRSRFAAAEPV